MVLGPLRSDAHKCERPARYVILESSFNSLTHLNVSQPLKEFMVHRSYWNCGRIRALHIAKPSACWTQGSRFQGFADLGWGYHGP